MEAKKIEAGSVEEEVNLSELFPTTKENAVYGYDYGPIEEIEIDGRIILYRTAGNSKGVGFGVVLGEKISDVYKKDRNEYIRVGIVPKSGQQAIAASLRDKIKGRIDFL